jgi:hypothetical protein
MSTTDNIEFSDNIVSLNCNKKMENSENEKEDALETKWLGSKLRLVTIRIRISYLY